jgi:DNA/RNA-binding domain of Phe-tRNA-synthetase-like protein
MVDIHFDPKWSATFPGAQIGLLLIGKVDNARRPTPLEDHKRRIEASLRAKYAAYDRPALLGTAVLGAYRDYYKTFNKTYHVLLQLESIVFKGKTLPRVNPLVDANFAAEMETLLLSAGHDADRLAWPVTIDASEGTETFVQMNGSRKTIKARDMIMKDQKEVVCTVIYGQDQRTPISPETRRALYVTYVPSGIDRSVVDRHLETIQTNIRLFAPAAAVEHISVHQAG